MPPRAATTREAPAHPTSPPAKRPSKRKARTRAQAHAERFADPDNLVLSLRLTAQASEAERQIAEELRPLYVQALDRTQGPGIGRPPTITPEQAATLVVALREGNYFEVACACAGVPPSTARQAVLRCEQEGVSAYQRTIGERVKSATPGAERALLRVARAGGKGWQAAMTCLERRFADRWSKRDRIDITSTVRNLESASDADLAALAQRAALALDTTLIELGPQEYSEVTESDT